MGGTGFNTNDSSMEGDVYIQKISSYIRRNEEALANGLLCFSKNKQHPKVKPLRLSFTTHHLYYIIERIESSPLGVDVGPLNIKLDNPNHEPTFISFMANNARSSKHFESDAKSITSINSMKSIVSSASVYWRNFSFSKDPKILNKDLRYLYSSFTKIPCLILTPKTKISSISGYEEYPCDTSVPVKMFKNLQVLELIDYEPNEIFGWNVLSEQLRILIIRNSKVSDITEILFTLVIDDENGRSSFNNHKQSSKKNDWFHDHYNNNFGQIHGLSHSSNYDHHNENSASNSNVSINMTNNNGNGTLNNNNNHSTTNNNSAFKYKRDRATTTGGSGSIPRDLFNDFKFNSSSASLINGKSNHPSLPDNKWSFLKQLTISETSITSIPKFTFKPFNNLVKLNLSGNLLDKLPDGLDQLTNIKYLNFSDNYITNLKNLPRNLKHLSTLNFNNNKLTEIDGIENLTSLEKIDIRRNNLNITKLLKPLVLQFIKNPDTFDNIYLSGNNLPKGYRADLFNLFNGVKYKNNMKIDDSRPGYFESALLLDAEAAFKFLENFFDIDRRHSIAVLVPQQSQPRKMSITTNGKSSNITPSAAETNKITTTATSTTPSSSAKSHLQALGKGHTRGTKSTGDVNALLDPFSSVNLANSMKNRKPTHTKTTTVTTTSNTATTVTSGLPNFNSPNASSPTSTIRAINSPSAFSDTNSIISTTSIYPKATSPLSNNQNLNNQINYDISLNQTYTSSKPIRQSFTIPSSSSNMNSVNTSPSQARSLRHSSTMSQLDIESTSINNAAPNVITPIQVHVEGFQ